MLQYPIGMQNMLSMMLTSRGLCFTSQLSFLSQLGGVNEEGLAVLRQVFRFAAKREGVQLSVYCGRAWARLACNLQSSANEHVREGVACDSFVPQLDNSVSYVSVLLNNNEENWHTEQYKTQGEKNGPPSQLSQVNTNTNTNTNTHPSTACWNEPAVESWRSSFSDAQIPSSVSQ